MSQMQVVRSTIPYQAPSRTPRGSILDYAHVVEGVGLNDAEGLVWSYNCIGMEVDAVDCAAFLGLTKRFDGPSSTDGGMFVIQGGMMCKPFGFNPNDPGIRKAFDAREPEAVSTGLFETVFTDAADLTGGVAVPPVTALGLLEAYGYLDYAGQPILHLGPGMISQAAAQGAIVNDGGKFTTVLGTPVVVSSGYETKTGGVLDQDQWAFVTGDMVLARSEVVFENSLDQTTNDAVVLYERLYVVGIDCLVGKVKVKVY